MGTFDRPVAGFVRWGIMHLLGVAGGSARISQPLGPGSPIVALNHSTPSPNILPAPFHKAGLCAAGHKKSPAFGGASLDQGGPTRNEESAGRGVNACPLVRVPEPSAGVSIDALP